MKKVLLLPIVGLVVSCTMTGDIVPTGPDSYMISTVACPACGGTTKSTTMAFQEAGQFCMSQGKRLLQSNMTNDRWFNEAGETVLEFRCLDEDHPAFIRADERRDSDIIIEHR
ncbi:hypothetical protein [Paraperlucidibaca baekdonensis]|uniref:hypothetical protein n=1 Tax=Paraperlucidibaca baekdonensis TaxID=748120 RepID=UPI0011C069F0|nr:hypothetical protein [Paraperlucidibaca baekdonensis]